MNAACHELQGMPSANRLREVLAEALSDRSKVQRALKPHILAIETVDKMTDSQISAKARERFPV